MNILIIEDDITTAGFVAGAFKQAGYVTEHAADGESGLLAALHGPHDAAVVDIMLPKLDGLSVIRRLRAAGRTLPVIVLSARGSVDEKIRGLEAGGDDYLAKPFSVAELVARVQALLRRAGSAGERTVLRVEDLEMDLVTHRVTRAETPIDLAAFLRETADLYATVLEDRRLSLDLDLPPDPVPFPAHRDRLQRLVGNLLDNAIKFTPDGGTIGLSLSRDGDSILLRVSDTGCGIAPEDLPNVFRRFWRADTSRSLPGNGLGLALVQAIVHSYGGTIDCTSALSRGTCFTIALPFPAGG